jgi:hypothetical protein
MKGRQGMKTKTDISKNGWAVQGAAGIEQGKRTVMIFSLVSVSVAAFFLGGCAVAPYSTAYYAPDYGPYYSDYGYGGGPYYYGYDPGYYGGYVIGSTRHRRYYGSHHFTRDFGTSRTSTARTAPRTTTRTVTPPAPRAPSRR